MIYGMTNIRVCTDHDAMMEEAARRWTALATAALDIRGSFHVALSGGSTPAGLYRRLSEPSLRGLLDWSRVHIWFGDERCVDPEHADSNFRMAKEALLRNVPLVQRHIHRIQGESADPRTAASEYAKLLNHLRPTGSDQPVLDLIMLGVGSDGHIASLFPGSDTLEENRASVAAAHIDEEKGWRISLTLPVIKLARHVMLLASGESKAEVMAKALSGDPTEDQLPVGLLRGLPQAEWYLDRSAAAKLTANAHA